MSVDRIDYVIYGVNVGYETVSYDEFEAEICGEPDARFDLIYDGMGGNFAYAGKIIARTSDWEGWGNGLDLTQQDESQMAAIWKVIQAFPDLNLGMNDFKLYVVTQFT